MRPSEALAKHRDEVLAILARYPVANPRIFGSVARGEDREGSDIDILVDRVGSMSFSDLFRMEDEVAGLVGFPVEIATGLKPHVAERAVEDMKPL